MAGALMWVVYGLASHARPVVAANLLVLTAAAISIWRPARETVSLVVVPGDSVQKET
jgi:hypothetical protein